VVFVIELQKLIRG